MRIWKTKISEFDFKLDVKIQVKLFKNTLVWPQQ